jgi:hypothetical protein
MRNRSDLFIELVNSVSHRGAQLIHDINECERDFKEIASIKASLEQRSREFAPAGKSWIIEKNARVDTSNPNEQLALLRGRLRYAMEDFAKAAELLRKEREALAELAK